MTYPRERNGYVDDGKRIGSSDERCPNCGSSKYYQTVSREHCPDCGLEFDYWGSHGNDTYNNFIAQREAAAKFAQLDEDNDL